ncbi:MAG: DUF333 domain-containing protein [Candidatus Peribacteraceae bacterium]|nr:DUF333 domain-containing protein [Candidatus Peribacteraceae bacterium]
MHTARVLLPSLALLLCTACLPGSPAVQQPPENSTVQQQVSVQKAAEAYIRSHISQLSPEPAVLGGTFYVTEIEWQNDSTAVVSYEDGHIALRGRARIRANGAEVTVESFSLIPDALPPPKKEEPVPSPMQEEEPQAEPQVVGMANPASVGCEEAGGTLRIEKKPPAGGEYGVCYFAGNRQCEEWALLRSDCPAGGVDVAGYVTPAARYCAITGGAYRATNTDGEEQGTCTFKNGRVCDAWDLWEGRC